MTSAELKQAAIKIFGEHHPTALAEALGVTYVQVWRYLSGRNPVPGPVVAAVKMWLKHGAPTD